MKLSFSLGSKAKPSVGEAPSLRKPAVFGSLDDDDRVDAAPTASSSRRAPPPANSSHRPARRKDKVDASITQYDEVYDDMKAAEDRAKAAQEEKDKDKKSKYMDKLLASAETRKLDYVRAEEKLMQREREKEGDEFMDKEKFVTPAYKAQMEAVRQAEEEEKKREEAEKKKRKMGAGLASFYRDYLQHDSSQHEAVVAATQAVVTPQEPAGQDLRIRRPLKIAPDPDSVFKPASDIDLAQEARAQGKEVELNDDNQLVDKRELLSAGLNLAAPNTRNLTLSKSKTKATDESIVVHTAVGTAASLKEIRARQARELEKQYEEERKRSAEERERKEREEHERRIKRKNTESDVQSARDRYLERKRRKLEEEQQAQESRNT